MHRVAAGLLIATVLITLAPGQAPADDNARPIVVAEVVERDVKESRAFVGSVEPVQSGSVDVEISGLLETLLVEEGDAVEPGTPIATLRATTVAIRLRAARAELRLRGQELLEMENGSRPEEKARDRARVRETKADEAAATWKLSALKTLRAKNQISEDELRDGERAVATAIARREIAEAALALAVAGPRAERIAQAQARVAVQAAEVERLEDEEQRHTVKAPYKGFVTKRHTEVGAWLSTGQPVVELVRLDEVDVVVPVLEDAVAHLRPGMAVSIVIDALAKPLVEGVIHRIVPVADRRARTIPVKIRVKNTLEGNDARIKIGMFARVALAVGPPRPATLVPKDAVVLGGRSPVVYVYDAETQTASPVPVELGAAVDDLIAVRGAVTKGQQVVTRGNERIFPGTKVRPMESK